MKRIIFLLIIMFSLVSCVNTQNDKSDTKTSDGILEVFYFYGKQRCVTCRAIEQHTKEVIENKFTDEVKQGKMILHLVDISTPEGKLLAKKYEVTWSSLILDRYGKIVNLTDMGFSYAKNEPDVFKSKLIDEIVKMLK